MIAISHLPRVHPPSTHTCLRVLPHLCLINLRGLGFISYLGIPRGYLANAAPLTGVWALNPLPPPPDPPLTPLASTSPRSCGALNRVSHAILRSGALSRPYSLRQTLPPKPSD